MNGIPRLTFMMGLALVLVLNACGRSLPPSTPAETTPVNALTSPLITRCVGRYLIDMPADAAMSGTLKVDGVTIEATAMSLDAYRKAISARSKALQATRAWHGYRFLYTDNAIDGLPESRLFVSLGDTRPLTDAERLVEAYRWDKGYQIKLQISASDANDSRYFKDKPRVRDDPDMTNVPARTRRVVALLSQVRGRPDENIPTQPGVCFQGGFLVGSQRDSEDANMAFALPDHHDVSFNVQTDTDVHDDTTLLQRHRDIDAALARDPIGKTLRKGNVDLQGMNAEEWLMQKTTFFKVSGFLFSLEANSLPNKSPVVMLDMRVGAPSILTGDLAKIDKASLGENQSLALWDAVSRTLRPRPNAF